MEWSRIEPLFSHYPLEDVRVSKLAPGRFHLKGTRRSYECRVVPARSAKLRLSLTDHLAARRFRTTQRFLLTKFHDRTLSVGEDQALYVTDALPGAPLSASHDDVMDAVDNLVRLHDGMASWTATSHLPDHTLFGKSPSQRLDRYGQWTKQFQSAAAAFRAEHFLSKQRGNQPMEQRWRDWLERWEELAVMAMDHLSKFCYAQLSERWSRSRGMAWNGYQLGALQRGPNGRVYTPQLTDPVFDSPLLDLATLCMDMCNEGQVTRVEQALARYARHRPLDPEETEVVVAYAAFPHIGVRRLRERRRGSDTVDQADWLTGVRQQYTAARKLLQRASQRGGNDAR